MPEEVAAQTTAGTTGSAPEAPDQNVQAQVEQEAPKAESTGSAPVENKPSEQTEKPGSAPEEGAEHKKLRERAQRAEQEAAYLRGRLEQPAPTASAPVVQPVNDPSAPRIEDFQTYEQYEEARISHAIEKREKQKQSEERSRKFAENFKKASAEIPDLNDTISAARIPMRQETLSVIYDSDQGPQIAYHLAKHQDEAIRISQMDPILAAREIGKIEAKLQEQQTPKQTRQVSQAPEPIKPLGITSSSQAPKALHELSYEEFVKARNANPNAPKRR